MSDARDLRINALYHRRKFIISGGDRHALRSRTRSGHHEFARDRVRRARQRARHRPAGAAADLSAARLGRARPAGDLARPTRLRATGARACRHRGARDRGDRHHQPARDHGAVGPRYRRAAGQRDRLAGPPHRRHLRRAEGRRPRAAGARKDRPGARPVLLRHQAQMAARHPARRTRTRAARRTGVRHRRQLADLAPDGRATARERHLECLAHLAAQHRDRRVGRRVARAVRHSGEPAAARGALERRGRRDRPDPVRRRDSRLPASPATSRPRCSARAAMPRARRRTPTAPAASC